MMGALGLLVVYVLRAIAMYSSLVLVAPLFAVYQEHKIWAMSDSLPSLSPVGYLKVYLVNVYWMSYCLLGTFLILPKWILSGMAKGSVEDEANAWTWGSALSVVRILLGPVEVRGSENLPPPFVKGTVAPVYVANHCSQIDPVAVSYLRRRFSWIAKESMIALPGLGSLAYLGGHILIRRRGKNRGSSLNSMYSRAGETLRGGTPIFIFPQGTRRMSERLPFKDGAFNIALMNKAPIVPVSISIPLTAWNDNYPFNALWGGGNRRPEPIVLTVHRTIDVNGDEDKETLKRDCFQKIYSVLPEKAGSK